MMTTLVYVLEMSRAFRDLFIGISMALIIGVFEHIEMIKDTSKLLLETTAFLSVL